MCERWNRFLLKAALFNTLHHLQYNVLAIQVLTISDALLSPGTSLVTSTVASTSLGSLTGHPSNTFPVSPSRTHTYLVHECSFFKHFLKKLTVTVYIKCRNHIRPVRSVLGEYMYLPYAFDSADLKLLAATQVDTEKTEN